MKRRHNAVLLIALLVFIGCSDSDDPVVGPDPIVPPPSFQDLSEKEHVIDNLVLSYTRRDLDELDALLDAGFFFYFSSADVVNLGVPPSWGRADEMIASNSILADGSTGPDSIVTIDLEIPYDTLHWDETLFVTPQGIETRYVTTLSYDFTFKTAGDITFAGSSMEAIFTVRNAGSVDAPEWRLIRWEDLGGTAAVTNGPTGSSAVAETTWGLAKWYYHPDSDQ